MIGVIVLQPDGLGSILLDSQKSTLLRCPSTRYGIPSSCRDAALKWTLAAVRLTLALTMGKKMGSIPLNGTTEFR